LAIIPLGVKNEYKYPNDSQNHIVFHNQGVPQRSNGARVKVPMACAVQGCYWIRQLKGYSLKQNKEWRQGHKIGHLALLIPDR
jgi:hypothetical protein